MKGTVARVEQMYLWGDCTVGFEQADLNKRF